MIRAFVSALYLPQRRVAPVVAGGSLPTWRTSMAIGEWKQLTGAVWSGVEPSPLPSPLGTGPNGKVIAWTSMCADIANSILYGAAGGGHGDYSGNEVDKVDLSANSPAFAQVRAPTLSTSASVSHYGDGRPTSRHHYFGVEFDPEAGRILLLGGARYGDGFRLTTMDGFSIASGDYLTAGTYTGNWNSTIRTEEQYPCCRDTRNGNIYLFGQFQIAKWLKSGNSWSDLQVGTGPAAYGAGTAWDSSRNRVMMVGGAYSANHTYAPDTDTVSSFTLSGAASGSVSSAGGMGFVYDSALDVFLCRTEASGGTVYQITPSGVTTSFSTSGGSSITSMTNPGYKKFLYMPALTGCVYVPDYSSGIWFLRTS